MIWNASHLHEDSKEVLVLRRAPTRARVLPVKVQTITLIPAQEFDDRGNESLVALRRGNHSSETKGERKKAEGRNARVVPTPCSE